MKIKSLFVALILGISMTSCMINTHTVGAGAQGSTEVRKKSIYILQNRIHEADSQAMAGGATDYTIDTRTNLVDMIINSVTFGILQTRTVIVKK
ncbi:MAG: Bor/Iss family lipoprotein [Cytophagaceae bacterium]